MVSFYRLVLFCLLISKSLVGYGQNTQNRLITGDFNNTPFSEFVKAVEAQTNYYFYFDLAAVDSVSVTMQVQNKPLAEVLPLALKNTNLYYAVDAENRVYITAGAALELNLPANYFKTEDPNNTVTQNNPVNNTSVTGPGTSRSISAAERKLYEIGRSNPNNSTGKATLAGHLRDVKSGEPVIGAAVYIQSPSIGVSTDQFGYYALTLPLGRHDLLIRGSGIKNTKRQILLQGDGQLEIEVEEDITPLKEVVIEAEKDKNVAGMQMGLEKLDIKTMRQVPTAFGETDILRIVLTLPGVKSVGEGNTGMNVRGGATDQNLILFNDATIYNPSHLFGFFSAFNPDILKTVELYKSAIPAKYGGRLASVLEIATRDGNKKQFSGAGGIGLLTSRLTLEGPIIKDKSSFLVGGRSTYSDWILQKLPNSSFKESAAAFYDLNAHISHEIDAKNTVYATGYLSRDKFKLAADTLYQYLNQNASLKWKHIFNNKLYGVILRKYAAPLPGGNPR